MKKFFIALFALVLTVSACQKSFAQNADAIVSLEYYRFPNEVGDDDSAKYRLSLNVGIGGNFLFTDTFGIRAQSSLHIPVLSLLANSVNDDEETDTDFGFGWSVGVGPVFIIPVGNESKFEISIQLQNFLATNYYYNGGSDSFALGGEILYRTNLSDDLKGFAIGVAYYRIFNEYFFKQEERYTGFNKGFIIRPEICINLGF